MVHDGNYVRTTRAENLRLSAVIYAFGTPLCWPLVMFTGIW